VVVLIVLQRQKQALLLLLLLLLPTHQGITTFLNTGSDTEDIGGKEIEHGTEKDVLRPAAAAAGGGWMIVIGVLDSPSRHILPTTTIITAAADLKSPEEGMRPGEKQLTVT